jgi:GNAT superfamily N-acetyltransferase
MAHAAVRPAEPADAGDIARIQVSTWRLAYAEILPPEVLGGLDEQATASQWLQTVLSGPAKVFVATEGDWMVGFCAAGPAPEVESVDAAGRAPADAATVTLVSTVLVEPRWARRGHGRRLLASAARVMRQDGATRGICWVPEADEAALAFYHQVGWQPDGTVRTLDAGGRPVRELRLTGDLSLEPV